MKSDRRAPNDREEPAVDPIGNLRPFLPWIAGGVAIIFVGMLVFNVMDSAAKGKSSEAWTEFYLALPNLGQPGPQQDATIDADAFADVASEYSSTAAGNWAHRTAGISYLSRGLRQIYTNKEESQELLGKAIEELEAATANTDDVLLLTQVYYNLGQAHESLGNLSEAAGYYEDVLDNFPSPGLKTTVEKRLNFINSDSGKEFYGWFAKLEPKPEAPIDLPSDFKFPPSQPDLKFSPDNLPELPGADAADPAAPAPVAPEGAPTGDGPELPKPPTNLELPLTPADAPPSETPTEPSEPAAEATEKPGSDQ